MQVKHVEQSYTTYHGTTYDTSYTAYLYSGTEEHQSLTKLCEDKLPILVENLDAIKKEREDDLAEKVKKYEIDIAVWNELSIWNKMFHNRPYKPKTDGWEDLETMKKRWEAEELNEQINRAKNLVLLLEGSSKHTTLFLYEDKNNQVVKSLMCL